jgi:YD repeat-containing protein
VAYTYDNANRMTGVDGVSYAWDNNGNLLSDGASTYTYDAANRLVSIVNQQSSIENRYNGLGDRLQETVNNVTTTFTMDLNMSLTQALIAGDMTYLYGNSSIAEEDTVVEYYLGDALGSVRQLADEAGAVTYAAACDPYGDVLSAAGDAGSSYGYTGEWTDSYIKLIYLRARY